MSSTVKNSLRAGALLIRYMDLKGYNFLGRTVEQVDIEKVSFFADLLCQLMVSSELMELIRLRDRAQ